MTTNPETPRLVVAGNGTRGPFTLSVGGTPITYAAASELVLRRYDDEDELVGTLVINTDYTLSATSRETGDAAATFTLDASEDVLATGQSILVERVTAKSSDFSLPSTGGIFETTVDKQTRLIQELNTAIGRRVEFHPLHTGSAQLPAAVASNFIGWNAAATDLVNYEGVTDVGVSAAMAAVLDGTQQQFADGLTFTATGGGTETLAEWLSFQHLPDEIRTESGNPLSIPDGISVTSADFIGASDGSTQFTIGDVTEAVNNYEMQGAQSGSGPVLAVVGAGTNVDANVAAKGTGGFWVGNGSGDLFAVLDSGGVPTSIPALRAAITGADNPIIYGVDSSETNKAVAIIPKGNAALLAADPDGTSVGGNSRGVYATDLQRERGANTQVASGANASIVGGKNNTGSGADSVVGGSTNVTSGQGAVAFGNANLSSGFCASVAGNSCTASARASRAGGEHALAQVRGKDAWSGQGFGTTQGSCQSAKQTLQATTTDATQTTMTSDGAATAASNQILLQDNSVVAFSALISARDGAGAKFAGYEIKGLIRRNANAAATVLLASTVTVLYETNAAWDCDAAAGTGSGVLNFRVTGEAALTVYWGATVHFHETVHA